MAKDTLSAPGFFEKHADKIEFGAPTGCWLWSGANNNGYGCGSTQRKGWKAHRRAYEAAHGEGSAAGLEVRHRCDTPACINPDHLEVGAHAENMRDMRARGRHVPPRRINGEANGAAKLTEADVRAIRAAYVPRSSTHSQRALAKQYGVNQTLICYIIRREIWTNVS